MKDSELTKQNGDKLCGVFVTLIKRRKEETTSEEESQRGKGEVGTSFTGRGREEEEENRGMGERDTE